MKHRTGKDFRSGGKFLSEPGTYHLTISEVQEPPEKKDGTLIANGAFRVGCVVQAGTVDNQEEKQTDILFFNPDPSKEDDFATKKIDRFLLAVGLLGDGDTEKEIEIDLQRAVGCQIVAHLEKDRSDKYLQLAFADIYHIDDPDVRSIPKKEASLKLIPESHRKVGAKSKPAPKKQQKLADLLDL